MINGNKQILRKKYQKIRLNIVDKEKKDRFIFEQIINNELVKKSKLILIYFSKQDEVDTKELIKFFLASHKLVDLPQVVGKEIVFYYIKSIIDVETGKFGLKEPITNCKVLDYSNSICIVPGICFDRNNYRVGYGGGYYDRFLKNYKGYTIGITYSECLVDKIDIDRHDIKLDKVIYS